MTGSNNPANDGADTPTTRRRGQVVVSVANGESSSNKSNQPARADSVNQQRLKLYHAQLARQADPIDAPFPIETLRDDLIELKQFSVAQRLDRRAVVEMDALYAGFDHLYIADDLIKQILIDLPDHPRFGWEVTSRVRNYLCLPTVGMLPRNVEEINDLESVMCYVLTHFGVASYTNDRAYYFGNIAGYLLISYFLAHLKIQYSITSLRQSAVPNFTFETPSVATNTEHVANIPLITKKKIYQLAVFCAQISLYAVDRVIEKMLIAEVNDFDKKKEQAALARLLRYGG